MEIVEWLGCGVAEHPEDCLCDVVITDPLPPLKDCITDGVHDLWMGRMMCDVRGYGRPWTDAKILEYFCDLVKFYDEFHKFAESTLQATSLHAVPPVQLSGSMPQVERWAAVRTSIHECSAKFPEPLFDVITQLGFSPQEAIDAMTTHKAGWGWTDERFQKLDALMSEPKLNYNQIIREMKLTKGLIRGLRKYWEPRRLFLYGTTGNVDPAKDMLYDLAFNSDMTPSEVVRAIEQRHGVVYNRSTVSKLRKG